MQNLTVSLVQSHLAWENPTANRQHLEKQIQSIGSTDIIVFAEMFTTAFTMNSKKMAEPMHGDSVSWMKKMANEKDAVICGSLIIEDLGKYYNRFLWVEPNGDIQYYNKRHLFRMANEHQFFTQGNERIIIEYKGWRICPMICYDLRFPVWSRNDAHAPYDLLIYVANWPSPRASAWSKLLMARAIENQAYTIGVNRIGEDEKGLKYIGGSAIIDPKGEIIWEAKKNNEAVQSKTIQLDELNAFREKFPLKLDADNFEIKLN